MKSITEWEVLTPDGWKDFSGVVQFEKQVLTITLKNGMTLTGSESHRVVALGGMKQLNQLNVGDQVWTNRTWSPIESISELKESQPVYDLVDVKSSDHEEWCIGRNRIVNRGFGKSTTWFLCVV